MITLILVLIVVGFLLWIAETYIPMAPPLKAIIRVVCILAIVIYILRFFFGWPIRIP